MSALKGSRENSRYEYNITTQAAGTGTVTGGVIDMGGNNQFNAVEAMLAMGDNADTAVIKIKAYEGTASGTQTTSLGTLTHTVTAAGTSDDKMLVLDVTSVTKRYVRFDVVTATANITIEALITRQYNARYGPISATAGDVVAGKSL